MTTDKKEQSSRAKASTKQKGKASGGAKAQAGKGGSARKSSGKGGKKPAKAAAPVARPVPRLIDRFRGEVTPQLMKEFEYSSVMQVPRLTKIMMNIGIGQEASENSQAIENATGDITKISGQRPVVTRARKSIAGFKLREGTPVGVAVTLRDKRMYEFFDRLVSSSLPRIRDFRGVSPESFDGRGNYSLGIREQIIFPEIDYNAIDKIRGLQVVITTTARTDREGFRLLELMGMPFARSESEAARL